MTDNSSQLTFIDLFCGIGGFHQALSRFGYRCVFACDKDKHCRETYKKNYGIEPAGDITKIDIGALPDFDILCGGFPCQTFSNAGKKKSTKVPKGKLFLEIIKIAAAKKPKFMFLENVKHIKRIDDGKAFKMIINEIRKIGYYIDENKTIFELSPHQLGVPQQRERVVFVCIRNDLFDETKPIIMNIPSVEVNFDSFFETDIEVIKKYKIKGDILDVLNIWNKMIKIFEIGEKLSPTIMCNEFYKNYTEEEFKALAVWRQDYIIKNKPIYNKYKKQWDAWYIKYGDLLSKREIYGKLEWQAGKKKDE